MSVYKVVHPELPVWNDIPGTTHIGRVIQIKGSIPSKIDLSSYIQVNLCESATCVPLHISIRFQYRVVALNSYGSGKWEKEESYDSFPFSLGNEFLMEISVQPEGYDISVDGRHCWHFAHRLSYLKVTKLHIAGPVIIQHIEYSHKKNKGQPGSWDPSNATLKPVINPTVPFSCPLPGGIKAGMNIHITGKPLSTFHRFTVSLQCGNILVPPPDIAFHFDACAFNSTVVRNTRRHETWEDEETAAPYFPFRPDDLFRMTIQVRNDKYIVVVNGQNFIEYYHRMPRFTLINTLKIDNDINIASVRFETM